MNRKQYLNNIKKTLDQAYPVVVAKSKDYAGENPFENFEASQIIGIEPKKVIMSRMLDKFSRIHNLLYRAPSVTDEQIEDTIQDLINYSAILKARIDYEKSYGANFPVEDSNLTDNSKAIT